MTEEDEKINRIARCFRESDNVDTTRKLLKGLTAKEAIALRDKYGIELETNLTVEEVAAQFDVTRERIRKIEEKALRKLKENFNDMDGGPDAR